MFITTPPSNRIRSPFSVMRIRWPRSVPPSHLTSTGESEVTVPLPMSMSAWVIHASVPVELCR